MLKESNDKVLLVDDERDITEVITRGLKQKGFEVDAFNDPVQALSQFKPEYYDHIILDVKMPGMTGFKLAKEIWTKQETANICFLSAFDIYEKEARIMFKDLKSTCFVTKPILPSKLAEHIEQHLTS